MSAPSPKVSASKSPARPSAAPQKNSAAPARSAAKLSASTSSSSVESKASTSSASSSASKSHASKSPHHSSAKSLAPPASAAKAPAPKSLLALPAGAAPPSRAPPKTAPKPAAKPTEPPKSESKPKPLTRPGSLSKSPAASAAHRASAAPATAPPPAADSSSAISPRAPSNAPPRANKGGAPPISPRQTSHSSADAPSSTAPPVSVPSARKSSAASLRSTTKMSPELMGPSASAPPAVADDPEANVLASPSNFTSPVRDATLLPPAPKRAPPRAPTKTVRTVTKQVTRIITKKVASATSPAAAAARVPTAMSPRVVAETKAVEEQKDADEVEEVQQVQMEVQEDVYDFPDEKLDPDEAYGFTYACNVAPAAPATLEVNESLARAFGFAVGSMYQRRDVGLFDDCTQFTRRFRRGDVRADEYVGLIKQQIDGRFTLLRTGAFGFLYTFNEEGISVFVKVFHDQNHANKLFACYPNPLRTQSSASSEVSSVNPRLFIFDRGYVCVDFATFPNMSDFRDEIAFSGLKMKQVKALGLMKHYWLAQWAFFAAEKGFYHLDLKEENLVRQVICDWDNVVFQLANRKQYMISDSRYYWLKDERADDPTTLFFAQDFERVKTLLTERAQLDVDGQPRAVPLPFPFQCGSPLIFRTNSYTCIVQNHLQTPEQVHELLKSQGAMLRLDASEEDLDCVYCNGNQLVTGTTEIKELPVAGVYWFASTYVSDVPNYYEIEIYDMAEKHAAQNQYAEAEAIYLDVIATREVLAAADKAVPDTRLSLACGLERLASIYELQNKSAEALAAYERALELRLKAFVKSSLGFRDLRPRYLFGYLRAMDALIGLYKNSSQDGKASALEDRADLLRQGDFSKETELGKVKGTGAVKKAPPRIRSRRNSATNRSTGASKRRT